MDVSGSDKLAFVGAAKWGTTGLQVTDELRLRAGHSKVLRFPFKCLLVIAGVEQLQPMERGRSCVIFIRALLGPCSAVRRTPSGSKKKKYAERDS
jgi:hypothetical protein